MSCPRIDSSFILSVTRGTAANMTTILEQGANVHHMDDDALQYIIGNYYFLHQREKLAILLEYGANIYAHDSMCLKCARTIFNKEFDRELADTLLPYCKEEDYHYFPEEYIKIKIVSTKSAANV